MQVYVKAMLIQPAKLTNFLIEKYMSKVLNLSFIYIYIQYYVKIISPEFIMINEKKETTEKHGLKIIVLNSQAIFCE